MEMNSPLQLASATVPQLLPKKSHGGAGPKTSSNRRRFLKAYEETFGNISASCEFAGISRRTFYRWMKSETQVNRKFRADIERIKPREKFVDWVESKLAERINAGDTTAIIYALKTQGRRRGYGDRLNEANEVNDREADPKLNVKALLATIKSRASDKQVSFEAEATAFLNHFGAKLTTEMRAAVELECRRSSAEA